ncbi:nitroreductase/FMN reductase [NAD(P)H] [Litoreibacter ascidiaceicola]|uniref:Nitroreductase/FMN reductase [NAD(P)H] n=1 Tax=Litoreibacter ascidiaceicola TaxID=1486859 RepID=A0A1M4ZTH8_9RHOB|nr:nitroreductase family protein [Litoreibacter ascidiaceicola]SHF21380.1 nitroreductase/FMN reductase [NAD(P)H] [Litoreibacter ascidiaceicola]
MTNGLSDVLAARFMDAPDVPEELQENPVLQGIAGRASCRAFLPRQVPLEVLKTLSAVALSSPSKSDLQQRDIVIVEDAKVKAQLVELVSAQAWIAGVPSLVVICANNRRQRQLHEMQGLGFANDHLDAFFNASVDAGIALASFVIAAEAAGLGCCPISTIRNHAQEASELLGLPDHVFPVAALALGYPASEGQISPRLPLRATVHVDRFSEDPARDLAEYDAHRAQVQPYRTQRSAELYGTSDRYTWSMDKARQYSLPERVDFGAFIKAKGFTLD